MPFWDRFIQGLFFGLAQDVPTGRDAALRILKLAHDRSRLPLSTLNPTSQLLLLALLPGDSEYQQDIQTLVFSSALHQDFTLVARLLREAAPPRLSEVVEIYRQGGTDISRASGPQLRAFALKALQAPDSFRLSEDLGLYLGWRFLIDPANPELHTLVGSLITEATQRYARVPLGTMDYLVSVGKCISDPF